MRKWAVKVPCDAGDPEISSIVILRAQFEFCSEGPGCRVKGLETAADTRAGTSRREVQLSAPGSVVSRCSGDRHHVWSRTSEGLAFP